MIFKSNLCFHKIYSEKNIEIKMYTRKYSLNAKENTKGGKKDTRSKKKKYSRCKSHYISNVKCEWMKLIQKTENVRLDLKTKKQTNKKNNLSN